MRDEVTTRGGHANRAGVEMVGRMVLLVAGLAVAAVGCGGDDDDGAAGSDTTARPSELTTTAAPDTTSTEGGGGGETSPAPAATTAAGAELPSFSSDFDRLCTTQVGYGGAAAYDGGPGVHPVIVFKELGDDGTFTEATILEFPAGWLVQQDDDFEDNSELAAVQLVACADRTATTPTGISCDFDSDGSTVTLSLSNATYDVTVYAAKTGEVLGASAVDATITECPMFAVFTEGDTEFVDSLSDEELVNVVKQYVAPA